MVNNLYYFFYKITVQNNNINNTFEHSYSIAQYS